jgi:hypothetical protein
MPPSGSAGSGDPVEDAPGQQSCQHRAHGVCGGELSHGQSAHSPQNGQSSPITADLVQRHMLSSEAIFVACQRRPMTPDSFRFNV